MIYYNIKVFIRIKNAVFIQLFIPYGSHMVHSLQLTSSKILRTQQRKMGLSSIVLMQGSSTVKSRVEIIVMDVLNFN